MRRYVFLALLLLVLPVAPAAWAGPAAELHVTMLSNDVAQLYVPIVFTIGPPGQAAQTTRFLMNQTIITTPAGWTVASILPIPVPVQAAGIPSSAGPGAHASVGREGRSEEKFASTLAVTPTPACGVGASDSSCISYRGRSSGRAVEVLVRWNGPRVAEEEFDGEISSSGPSRVARP